jgi:ParB family transcriptional regulator, chromosome partitioning protein
MKKQQQEEVQQVKVQEITRGKNPRTVFDPGRMDQLRDSIKTNGIIQPLILRTIELDDKKFLELVCGERRMRAAMDLGFEYLPAIIRQIPDEALRFVQLLENTGEKLTPMEEAEAFAELLQQPGVDAETVANKMGRKPAEVHQQLSLLNLNAYYKVELVNGRITVGHARHVARLPKHLQEELRKGYFGDTMNWNGDGTFRPGVRDLDAHIEQNFLLNLASAPFEMDDTTLGASLQHPAATSCAECPLRSGFNRMLFGEVVAKDERCLDGKCFNKKLAAHVARVQQKLRDKAPEGAAHAVPLLSTEYDAGGKKPGKDAPLYLKDFKAIAKGENECPSMVTGVWSDGQQAGKPQRVCPDPRCPVHSAPATLVKDATKNRDQAIVIAKKQREAILKAAGDSWQKSAGPLPDADLLADAKNVFELLPGEWKRRLYKSLSWEPTAQKNPVGEWKEYGGKGLALRLGKLSRNQLMRFIHQITIVAIASQDWGNEKLDPELQAVARRHEVDLTAAAGKSKKGKGGK